LIVIVVGMHRSGTSAVAGILHLNGISMGSDKTFRPKPLPQNPKGFYENYSFRKISDKILACSGYKVKSFNPVIPEEVTVGKITGKMTNLIHLNESDHGKWGWKDPRVCLTLHCWLDVLDSMNLINETRIVFVSRDGASVARSLTRRDGLSTEVGLRLWSAYNRRALNLLNPRSVQTFHFAYETLLAEPESLCGKLFRFLATDFDSSVIGTFIDPDLNRSGREKSESLTSEAAEVTERLTKLEAESLAS
tara:strand:+ start:17479 stop:18225 length:747 start_codon:yes stop_codon:yes gene_type:complete